MRDFKTEVKKMNDAINAVRDEYKEKAKGMLSEVVKEFFDETPEVSHIFWTQYIPSFNDGEACNFTRGDVFFILAQDLEVDEDDAYMTVDELMNNEGSTIFTKEDRDGYAEDVASYAEYLADKTAFLLKKKAAYIEHFGKSNWGEAKTGLESYLPYECKNPGWSAERLMKANKFLAQFDETRGEIVIANIGNIKTFLTKLDEDVLESLYGENARVIISKDEVVVEDYEGDY
jgi:hypothetical protein